MTEDELEGHAAACIAVNAWSKLLQRVWLRTQWALGWIPCARRVLFRMQALHVFLTELKVVKVRVFFDSTVGYALW